MRRAYVISIVGVGVLLFLAISAVLARVFSVDSAERSAITALVQAEARGDAGGTIERINGCSASAACRARASRDVATLTRSGSVSILQLDSSAGFSLGSTLGVARVAWNTGSGLPIVQCVGVRRAGNALSGFKVELLALSLRIQSDSVCPSSF
jgi:hypothetical protein